MKEGLTPMSPTERKFFNIWQQEKGYHPACQAKTQGDASVLILDESNMDKWVGISRLAVGIKE